MKMKIHFLLLFIALAFNQLLSQDSKNTVILLNTEPVRVELASNGEINTLYGIEEGYLDEFIVERNQFELNLVEKPLDPDEIEGYKIVFIPTMDLVFESQYATLNNGNIAKLDYVVNELIRDRDKKVIIRNPLNDNTILNKNRLKAIMTYLNIKGVSRGLILLEDREDGNETFEINIVK
jgi:hypothetical protein